VAWVVFFVVLTWAVWSRHFLLGKEEKTCFASNGLSELTTGVGPIVVDHCVVNPFFLDSLHSYHEKNTKLLILTITQKHKRKEPRTSRTP
jgi:hypothetical protein